MPIVTGAGAAGEGIGNGRAAATFLREHREYGQCGRAQRRNTSFTMPSEHRGSRQDDPSHGDASCERRIRVNSVRPVLAWSVLYAHDDAKDMSEEARQARRNRSLLETKGNGWDIGAAVRSLTSDQA